MREPVSRVVSSYYFKMYGPRPEDQMRLVQKRRQRWASLPHEPSINEFIDHHVKLHGDGCVATKVRNQLQFQRLATASAKMGWDGGYAGDFVNVSLICVG